LPEEIRTAIAELSSEFLVNSTLDKLERKDYEFELIIGNASSAYNASVNEILNFALKGTEIALELLNNNRTKQETWGNDKEIAFTLKRLVNERLTTENERNWGFHFASNSMFLAKIVEIYLRGILHGYFNGESDWALGFLYEIERSGNTDEAIKRFLPIIELIEVSSISLSKQA
jgi:hypothetical protein